MTEIITSIKNPDIKYLRKLYRSHRRRREEKFILEGTRLIEQALQAGAEIKQIFMTPDYDDSLCKKVQKDEGIKITRVSRDLIEEVADTVTPQGIIAVVDKPSWQPEDIFTGPKHPLLVLDRIQDPGNMGTLIRTAVAAGVGGLIALKGCVDIYNLKVLRATAGAVFSIPFLMRVELNDFLNMYSSRDYDLYCADLNGEQYYYEPDYDKPAIFVIGNEARGISEELLQKADYRIKIPLLGEIDSLNAGVSGSIILYEYLRHRQKIK